MAGTSYDRWIAPGKAQYNPTRETSPQLPFVPAFDKSIKQSIQIMENKINVAFQSLQREFEEQIRVLRDLDRIQKERDSLDIVTR